MNKSTLVLAVLLCCSYYFSNGQETLSQHKDDRLFQTGLDLLSHHEYGAAHKAFSDFISIVSVADSRKADAEYYRAFCALNLYHADGEKLLQDYISVHPLYPKAITAYYDLANFFYSEKNYPKASGYFAKVDFPALSAEQQNTGRFHWGYSLFSQKNLKESLDQFNTIKAQGGQYGPAASYYAGFIESSNGDYTNALIDLKRAETNSAYSLIVPVMITNVYYKQKDDNGLLAYSVIALEREGVTSADEISLLAAETYFRKGDYKKANPLYQQYVEEHEKNADRGVLYRAGYAAAASGSDDLALRYLKSSASDTDSIGVYASYSLGLLYLKRQEKPLALTAFELTKKFKKDPKLAEESLFLAAKINYELGKPDIAINEFELILKDYPQSSHSQEIRELLSQAYVNASNYNRAIEYIDALPRKTPAVERAYQKATYLKGTELFNKEDYAQAVQFFEKSLRFPIDADILAETYYWIGETYSVGRKYDLAISPYEHALGGTTKTSLIKDIRYGLGYAHYNLQQYDKSLYNFRDFSVKSNSSDPNYADGILRLGDSYYATKAYPDALSNYKKVILLNSPDADYAHYHSGIILAIQKKYGEAAAEFDAVAKNTASRFAEDAIFQHGQIDFEQSNYSAAVNQYSKVISASNGSRIVPKALARRAAANYNLKNYDQASNDYISVFDKFPTHPVASQELLVLLQESLNLANRSGEFDKYLAEFKNANPDATGIESVEFETAKNLYNSQNYAKAIDSFSKYLINYSNSPRISEAKYYQGESYYRIKENLKSLEVMKEIASDASFTMQNRVIARVAELEFKSGNYENAAKSFKRLSIIAANKKEQSTAWNGLMESYYLLAKYDSSEIYAKLIVEQGNVNVSAQNKASLYLGKSAKARGDYEAAKDEFLTTLNTAHDEYGAEAKYLLGEIFYLTKEYKQSKETLFSLNSEFSAYDEWVGKSYLLLVDNYIATSETFQAKGTLKSLIDNFPQENVRNAAKEKLKAIEQEEIKKKAVEKIDTTGNDK
ncbi:MAG: tetratricopeptide repeat protein [Cyclobacteriaceae bacterium]|nr:tetratricopeptide repeat protein [Cyclobacteriaceae bacterium]